MALDPYLAEVVRDWLAKAAADLRLGEEAIRLTPPFPAHVAFLSQQAAEKALKAFLTCHNVPFRKTHDLWEIGEQCSELDRTLDDLCFRARALTP